MKYQLKIKPVYIALLSLCILLVTSSIIIINLILKAPKSSSPDNALLSSTDSITESDSQPANQPSQPTVVSKVDTTSKKCKHDYYSKIIEPTCNSNGYTVHTCSKCGHSFNDAEVPAAHTYENYKCIDCGQVDKQNVYPYLVNWILENGETDGNYCTIETIDDEYRYTINYDKKYETVTLNVNIYQKSTDDYFFYTSLAIPKISDKYTYYSSLTNVSKNSFAWKYSGTIDCHSFTENTPLSYDSFYSDIFSSPDNNNLETTRINLILDLINTERVFTGEINGFQNSGISIDDLGFTSFAK